MTMTIPDVDLADGSFYADGHARDAYRWMRTHQPLFRDRNGLPAVTTYAGVIEGGTQSELFSNAGGIRPDQAAYPHMVDMDDPAHLMRRKLVNTGFTRKRVTEKMDSIEEICDLLIDNVSKTASAISFATWRRLCPWPSSATCSGSLRTSAPSCSPCC